jgi:hypothetical protein
VASAARNARQGEVIVGLLDGVLGNASKIDATKIQAEFARILAPGEKVEHAYQLIRDYFVFTDKRFVLVDKQGITGSKVEYHSIPYRSITHFSIETAGTFDLWRHAAEEVQQAPQHLRGAGGARLLCAALEGRAIGGSRPAYNSDRRSP